MRSSCCVCHVRRARLLFRVAPAQPSWREQPFVGSYSHYRSAKLEAVPKSKPTLPQHPALLRIKKSINLHRCRLQSVNTILRRCHQTNGQQHQLAAGAGECVPARLLHGGRTQPPKRHPSQSAHPTRRRTPRAWADPPRPPSARRLQPRGQPSHPKRSGCNAGCKASMPCSGQATPVTATAAVPAKPSGHPALPSQKCPLQRSCQCVSARLLRR